MHPICKNLTGALVGAALLINLNASAQVAPKPAAELPKSWHLMDLNTDGYFGISLNQAYQFVKGKKS